MRQFLSFLLLPLLASCSDYEVHRFQGVEVFYQKPADQVDILLIVDNSCSMAPYQTKLGNSFEQFISYFYLENENDEVTANVDYQIAVVTTDTISPGAGQIGQMITSETTNAAEVFSEIVNVGTSGSGFEMGLEGAYLALTPPLSTTTNADFIRDDASFSIIFVSDEQDASPMPVNDYINAFYDIKGQDNRDIFNASALAITDLDECSSFEASADSAVGSRYIDVAEQTGGIIGDLCADDFDPIVTDLSLATSRLTDTFFLSDLPDPATFQVSVNDEIIDCDAGEWTYTWADLDGVSTPAIVFGLEYLPAPSSQIAVRYDYGAGSEARFCDADADTGR